MSRSPDELRQASRDLHYEYGVFHDVSVALQDVRAFESHAHGPAAKHALMEAFGIHARLLYDFLWIESKNTDDVCASNFIASWPSIRPKREKHPEWRDHVNKLIAHLSYTRPLRLGSPDGYAWPYEAMRTCIEEGFSLFLREVPRDLMAPEWKLDEAPQNVVRYAREFAQCSNAASFISVMTSTAPPKK